MKLVKIILLALLTINTIGCKPSKKEETTEQHLPEKIETAYVNIEGMTCEIGCAKTIEAKISKIDGITSSKVSFEKKQGTFTYDSNKTSEELIINSINGLLDGKTYLASKSNKISCEKKCEGHKKTCCTDKDKPSCKKDSISSCDKDKKKSCEKKCEGKDTKASCTKDSITTCDKDKKKSCCDTTKK